MSLSRGWEFQTHIDDEKLGVFRQLKMSLPLITMNGGKKEVRDGQWG